jgi:hypothetical protein
MRLPISADHLPGRLAAGAYILHAGLEKWGGSQEQAAGVHGMASGAFPFLSSIPPDRFLRGLSAAELATGAALLTPFMPAALAGTALTAFSGGLLAMYLRTPALRKPNSVWPSQSGIAVSKDVWLLGYRAGPARRRCDAATAGLTAGRSVGDPSGCTCRCQRRRTDPPAASEHGQRHDPAGW